MTNGERKTLARLKRPTVGAQELIGPTIAASPQFSQLRRCEPHDLHVGKRPVETVRDKKLQRQRSRRKYRFAAVAYRQAVLEQIRGTDSPGSVLDRPDEGQVDDRHIILGAGRRWRNNHRRKTEQRRCDCNRDGPDGPRGLSGQPQFGIGSSQRPVVLRHNVLMSPHLPPNLRGDLLQVCYIKQLYANHLRSQHRGPIPTRYRLVSLEARIFRTAFLLIESLGAALALRSCQPTPPTTKPALPVLRW